MMATNTTSKSRRTKVSNNTHQAGLEDIREQAVAVGADVRELAQTAGRAAMDQMNPVEDYIREKPLKSMLIAAGVGALVGAIFLRR